MIGFMTDDRTVGLFTSGTKITHILTVVITSLSAVMLPRCAHLIGEGKIEEFNGIIRKSYYLLMFSAIPLTAGLILLARPLILCFCGPEYIGSIPVVVYTAPTIIFIGMTQIIGIQILYPYGKEMLVIYSTLVAAVLNVALNLLLIPLFAEAGAAISTLIAEFSVLVVQVKLGKEYIPFRFVDRQVGFYLMASGIMSVGVLLCMVIDNIWWQMLAATVVGAAIYTIVLYAKKDVVLQEVCHLVLRR